MLRGIVRARAAGSSQSNRSAGESNVVRVLKISFESFLSQLDSLGVTFLRIRQARTVLSNSRVIVCTKDDP